jgi:hypothetical protein
MLGKHRMVTVATRIEPQEIEKLRELATECGLSVCGYLRDLIRLELGRAERGAERMDDTELNGACQAALKVGAQSFDVAV